VLSSYERRQFNEIAEGLLSEDPEFGNRPQATRPGKPRRPGTAIMLWMSAPLMIDLGGGTGLLIAVVAAAYGLHLWCRGTGPDKSDTP
jgi:hypothetical protein